MAAVTICSDFGAPKNKVWHCFHCFPIYFPWGSLGAPITALHTAQGWLMHTTLALGGIFGVPDAHPWKSWILYLFHLWSWSSQRKGNRAKKLLLKGKLPEIWESTQPHNISSLKGEFQAKISASLSTLQPINIRVSTLRHMIFLLGHPAVNLQMFRVQAESSGLHFTSGAWGHCVP